MDVHTVPNGDVWVNMVDGERVGDAYDRKADAVAAGRLLAIELKSEHVIHRQDGVITEKNSYGNDPVGNG